ncbi:TolB family protein [Acanthopleuribacter pedis]|uniref:PD40 domain-containing protein n=1 Tax=Acanthopleuribacter pedis TaxID=442870 RepID=A0A8J7QFC3_9BACT|nr:PD40 domain-containing protein [Acanthopleuribacter pedis]MBO1323274.1 PD40 domain-containing protein [Acanthopleuribacter pedis]
MKSVWMMIVAVVTLFAGDGAVEVPRSQPLLKGPYLGQKPPGMTPEPFAPGIVTTERWEYCATFTPDLKTIYFLEEEAETDKDLFMVYEEKADGWYKSRVSDRVGQPFIAPDGKIMHLGRRYKERTADGWSALKTLDPKFTTHKIMRLTASAKGTYVFDDMGAEGGRGMIRYSRVVDGKHEQPKKFGPQVNSGRANAHPFIAADESFLMWDSRRETGRGNADLYICFKQADGTWGDAVNLGDTINTEASEFCPSVTPDGKYLVFHRSVKRGTADIMWVDAKILEQLRPK